IGLLVAAAGLSIVYIPLALLLIDPLFPAKFVVQPADIAKLVGLSVLLPLAVGMAIRQLVPALAQRGSRPGMLLAARLMLLALVPVLLAEWRTILSLIGNGTVLAFAALVAVGLLAGHLLAGSSPAERTVLALASGARHPGVAIALAHANFPDDKLVQPAVMLYLLVGTIVALPYVQWSKRASTAASASPPART